MRALRLIASLALAAVAADRPLKALDLQVPFAARSPWRLAVTQGPDEPDEIMGDGTAPGRLTLCLSRDGGRSCDPQPGGSLRLDRGADLFDAPHELRRIAVVRPTPDRPLLLIQIASLHSVNGDQRVGTELYGYDHAADRFAPVFTRQTGRNNNQEVRYVDSGPLAGAVVSAEPSTDTPFGFWITVERMAAVGPYRPVLRYRSVTRYGDGNPLAVIDSDMPEMQRRLGLWRPGRPLPIPARCAAPRLEDRELWCGPKPS